MMDVDEAEALGRCVCAAGERDTRLVQRWRRVGLKTNDQSHRVSRRCSSESVSGIQKEITEAAVQISYVCC